MLGFKDAGMQGCAMVCSASALNKQKSVTRNEHTFHEGMYRGSDASLLSRGCCGTPRFALPFVRRRDASEASEEGGVCEGSALKANCLKGLDLCKCVGTLGLINKCQEFKVASQ